MAQQGCRFMAISVALIGVFHLPHVDGMVVRHDDPASIDDWRCAGARSRLRDRAGISAVTHDMAADRDLTVTRRNDARTEIGRNRPMPAADADARRAAGRTPSGPETQIRNGAA